ncbi:hypothetical protein G4B88_000946 [Cannabis sativa]|uniref:Major facilitator superfamily (MFS) profile domain-containing protein n=1 Tax=Cannabis sativa TaxID=3483 RepID=A0A7J6E1P6_CANSA|nr:hypothetical protein G4B88_000946 [Cannabis sativa]
MGANNGGADLLAIAAATNVAGWCIISLFNRKDSSFLPTLGRILEGFGAGMISNLVPVYIAEITPNNMRGIFGAVHQARQGRVQEGNSILQELRGSGEDITHEWGEIMKATAVLALQQLSGTNGMILYARSIFGINDPEKSLKSIQTGVWFIQVLGTGLSIVILVKYSQKFVLGVGLFCFSLGMGPIPWIIMSEIIPEALKSNIAGCVPTFANWILLIGTNTDYYKQSSQWRFAFYAIAAAFTGGFTLIFMNE